MKSEIAKMKQKLKKIHKQSGFTIIELLVVISMMVVISTVLVIDFSRQRTSRSMIIGQNEMVTNLRKVQGYMLSSKNLTTGEAVKYYVMSFTQGESNYYVHAIDSQYGYHNTIETIKLPTGVYISSNAITEIGKVDPTEYKCLQIIFSAPYGKMYARGLSSCTNDLATIVQDPFQLALLNERDAIITLGNTSTATTNSTVITPLTGLITP
jgi:prepilin-type N-terminal cleavage/methylation domain-containing protein